jgi:septal ring factor EnvC (AmiA/AmiB activator)
VLNAEASSLRQKLVATAAQVQLLEEQKGRLDADIASLATQERASSEKFLHDRANVARLLTVLERLQQDMPPVLVLRPDDALAASRGAMMLGAALPRIYKAAADLAQRVALLKKTRAELVVRRAEGARNETALASARGELDQLLAMKSQEADEASSRYGDLASQLDSAANEAASLGALLSKVATLRGQHPAQAVVVVAAQNVSLDLRRGRLLRPVVGRIVRGDADSPGGEHAPGLSFLAPPSARVVAPTDCQVLFAGRYHKTGQVLILESAGGYDLVLAGLERVDVRSGDALLAGEPLGTMPGAGAGSRLYFELRQNGKGVSPAPWLEIDLRKAKRL